MPLPRVGVLGWRVYVGWMCSAFVGLWGVSFLWFVVWKLGSVSRVAVTKTPETF